MSYGFMPSSNIKGLKHSIIWNELPLISDSNCMPKIKFIFHFIYVQYVNKFILGYFHINIISLLLSILNS